MPDGPATGFRLEQPLGLTAGPGGEVFVVDAGNVRPCRLDPVADTVATVAGERN